MKTANFIYWPASQKLRDAAREIDLAIVPAVGSVDVLLQHRANSGRVVDAD